MTKEQKDEVQDLLFDAIDTFSKAEQNARATESNSNTDHVLADLSAGLIQLTEAVQKMVEAAKDS